MTVATPVNHLFKSTGTDQGGFSGVRLKGSASSKTLSPKTPKGVHQIDEASPDGLLHIPPLSQCRVETVSELTGQQGGQQIFKVPMPGPFTSCLALQLFQSKQKQSICLKLNNRQVFYLPCWFA